ncbi:uncharacterized protein DS421_19g653930 [Arachis hypogaea]|uniref:Uncharacterized protein n=1 Tax=Arachis hypogaea TaxID=3818 RepID=A0A6B9VBI9_ARAHY|nr:uncharacterized protein DS421_19g653930 [Arachis hypogaea]
MTTYVEPRQEEEEPGAACVEKMTAPMPMEESTADARGGEQRADARGREHRTVAVWGGRHRDRDLLSYVEESRDRGRCVAVGVGFKC